MRYTISTVFLLLIMFFGFAQSPEQNYVLTKTYKTPTQNPIGSPLSSQAVQQITYFDGLGRPIQQIAHKQSGDSKNLVTHIEYDGYGRQVREYLPYNSNGTTLNFVSGAESGTTSFYNTNYGSSYGYSKKELEDSPLSRVLRQAAPGDDWAMDSGHEIKFVYQTNTTSEVYHFKVNNPTGTPALALHSGNSSKYEANQLYKTIIKDENWESIDGVRGTLVEFKDKLGRVVLKRHYTTNTGRSDDTGITYDTYYVYDKFGNLTFVLPPKLSEQIVSGSSLVGNHQHLLDELGYRYTYDYRNRLIRKKLPGKRVEFIYYDKLNRVIKVGPVPNPFGGSSDEGYIHTKYDKFNRVVYTFWRESESFEIGSRESAPSSPPLSETPETDPITIDGIQVYYTNDVVPTDNIKLLTVNYYDDYRFAWAPGTIPSTIFETKDVYYNRTRTPKGLPTGTWVRVLEGQSATNATTTYTLYNDKTRPIRVHSNNYLGGYTTVDSKYDFSGKVLQTITTHQRDTNADPIEIKEYFGYTSQDRLFAHNHTINNNTTERLVQNSYDDLGQLTTKLVGGVPLSTELQKVDYTYNIRGWLTSINNVNNLQQGTDPVDLFAFNIRYTTPGSADELVTPLYNGNISRVYWRTASDNIRRTYGYSYDYLNRLLDAFYSIPGTDVNDSYNEHMAYDKNGNITALLRNGNIEHATNLEVIDDLTYDYDDGNKLINVTDTGSPQGFVDGNDHDVPQGEDDYDYDDYGNLIIDRNKGIDEIAYNHLHLPKKLTITGANTGTIDYLYDANGVKLKKIVTEGTTVRETDYLDSFQYVNDTLSFFPHAEGYVKVTYTGAGSLGGGAIAFYNYVYNYTDHLGNIRVRYTLDPETHGLAILEEDHYYPFGLKHEGYSGTHEIIGVKPGTNDIELVPVTDVFEQEHYKYKFNGVELEESLGLNMYETDYRHYDPALGRFFTIDPLTEVVPAINPYQFSFNNPIFLADPTGLIPEGTSLYDFIQDLLDRTPNDGRAHHYDSDGNHTGSSDPNEIARAEHKYASGMKASTDAERAHIAKIRRQNNYLETMGLKGAGDLLSRMVLNGGLNTEEILAIAQLRDNLVNNLKAQYMNAIFSPSIVADILFIGMGTGGSTISTSSRSFSVRATASASQKYAAIGSTGKVGENYLKLIGGESQVGFRTTIGMRFVDQLVGGIALESKVGYTTLTTSITRQIIKDAQLIATKQVKGATWHFFRSPVTGKIGASKPLMSALKEAGIKVIIH